MNSPLPGSSSTTPKPGKTHPKPANVFSNDGSFLEKFQRIKKAEDEKKTAEEIASKKRTFDDRFKKRGKRTAPTADESSPSPVPSGEPSTDDGTRPTKKPRAEDKPLTEYEKEVQKYENRSLKDQGIGVRPLVK